MSATEPPDLATSIRPTTKRVLQGVIGIAAAMAIIIWGLPAVANTSWGQVWDAVSQVPWYHAVLYTVLVLAGLGCYTFVITGSLPGITHLRALIVNVCGSSVSNLLPGGGAVGLAATYAICRSWGHSLASVTAMAVVTGVWNVLARVFLPVLALLLLWLGSGSDVPRELRDAALGGSVGGLLILAVFVAVLLSPTAARRVGASIDWLLRPIRRGARTSVAQGLADLRTQISGVVRTGWLKMTFGMAGFFAVYFLLFYLILAQTHALLPLPQLFAAYAIGRLLTSIGITPGGAGVTETGTVAALVAWGADPAGATAGVVIFAIFTYLLEVPLGAIGWTVWALMPRDRL
ncbi:lysylphosphatidylglycerol synthase transmembrane domain-containing protein, partial [Kribbia dieselivorans]|uniref:lysylphosphatidylglycerol synthase transmembrane domain-containing protein n=1 Tax=Kribbia dieselivorans TaxID=331526 RepID=UPI0008384ADE